MLEIIYQYLSKVFGILLIVLPITICVGYLFSVSFFGVIVFSYAAKWVIGCMFVVLVVTGLLMLGIRIYRSVR